MADQYEQSALDAYWSAVMPTDYHRAVQRLIALGMNDGPACSEAECVEFRAKVRYIKEVCGGLNFTGAELIATESNQFLPWRNWLEVAESGADYLGAVRDVANSDVR